MMACAAGAVWWLCSAACLQPAKFIRVRRCSLCHRPDPAARFLQQSVGGVWRGTLRQPKSTYDAVLPLYHLRCPASAAFCPQRDAAPTSCDMRNVPRNSRPSAETDLRFHPRSRCGSSLRPAEPHPARPRLPLAAKRRTPRRLARRRDSSPQFPRKARRGQRPAAPRPRSCAPPWPQPSLRLWRREPKLGRYDAIGLEASGAVRSRTRPCPKPPASAGPIKASEMPTNARSREFVLIFFAAPRVHSRCSPLSSPPLRRALSSRTAPALCPTGWR